MCLVGPATSSLHGVHDSGDTSFIFGEHNSADIKPTHFLGIHFMLHDVAFHSTFKCVGVDILICVYQT